MLSWIRFPPSAFVVDALAFTSKGGTALVRAEGFVAVFGMELSTALLAGVDALGLDFLPVGTVILGFRRLRLMSGLSLRLGFPFCGFNGALGTGRAGPAFILDEDIITAWDAVGNYGHINTSVAWVFFICHS